MRRIIVPAEIIGQRDVHIGELASLPVQDGARVALPALTYVFIVFDGRTGSTYLGELLGTTGFFNAAGELLNSDHALEVCAGRGWNSFATYFANTAAEKSRNAHFVVKASVAQLAMLAEFGILPRILARSRFIVTERMDKLAQAISWLIATRTGRYTSLHDDTGVEPEYDGRAIGAHLNDLIAGPGNIARFMAMNGIVPMHVSYEMLVSRPHIVSGLVCSFLGQAGLACDPKRVPLRRQATARNAEWRARFLAELQATASAAVPGGADQPRSAV